MNSPQSIHPLLVFAFGSFVFLQISLNGLDGIGDRIEIHLQSTSLFLHHGDGCGVVRDEKLDADVGFRRIIAVTASGAAGVDLIAESSEGLFTSRRRIALEDGTRFVRVEDEEDVFASAGVDEVVEDDWVLDVDQIEETRVRGIVGLRREASIFVKWQSRNCKTGCCTALTD